jgi:hypothetical protein
VRADEGSTMSTNGSTGCDDRARHSRPRHAAPWQGTGAERGTSTRRRGSVMLAVGTLAVATITAGLGPVAEADAPTGEVPASAVAAAPVAAAAPVVAPRTAAAVASSPGTAEAAKQARAKKRHSRASFRPSAAPYRFASKRFNRWYAKRYMAYKYHWHRKQFRCLSPLWGKESAWNERAHNSASGAHGIPQAMPGSKMAKYGKRWRTNPTIQVKWGLSYIKGVYRSPCRAWSFWGSHHWY